MCALSTGCRGSGGHELFASRVAPERFVTRLPVSALARTFEPRAAGTKTSERNLLCAGIHHTVLWVRIVAPLQRIPWHGSTDTSGGPVMAMSHVVSGLRCIARSESSSSCGAAAIHASKDHQRVRCPWPPPPRRVCRPMHIVVRSKVATVCDVMTYMMRACRLISCRAVA